MMPKEEPFDEALHELKNIINMLQTNMFKMVSTKDVGKSGVLLNEIEEAIKQFKVKAMAELRELGLTREQEEMVNDGIIPETIKEEHREALEIAANLKNTIEEMRSVALQEQGVIQDEPIATPKEKKDSQAQKREYKKKFRRLGDDEWKPL